MDALDRSLFVARTMLRGAACAVRIERERGLHPERQQLASESLAFWRKRFAVLYTQSCERARARARQASLPPK